MGKKKKSAKKKKKKKTIATPVRRTAWEEEGVGGRVAAASGESPGSPSAGDGATTGTDGFSAGVHSIAEVARIKHVMGYHADIARADAIINADNDDKEEEADESVGKDDPSRVGDEDAVESFSKRGGLHSLSEVATLKRVMGYHADIARADAIINADDDYDNAESEEGKEQKTGSGSGDGATVNSASVRALPMAAAAAANDAAGVKARLGDHHLNFSSVAKMKNTLAYHAVLARADAIIHAEDDPYARARGHGGSGATTNASKITTNSNTAPAGASGGASTTADAASGTSQKVITRLLTLQEEMLAAKKRHATVVRAKRDLEAKYLALEQRLRESEDNDNKNTQSLPSASEIAANMALDEARGEARQATADLAALQKTVTAQDQRLQRALEEQQELAAALRRSSESLAQSKVREEAVRAEAKAHHTAAESAKAERRELQASIEKSIQDKELIRKESIAHMEAKMESEALMAVQAITELRSRIKELEEERELHPSAEAVAENTSLLQAEINTLKARLTSSRVQSEEDAAAASASAAATADARERQLLDQLSELKTRLATDRAKSEEDAAAAAAAAVEATEKRERARNLIRNKEAVAAAVQAARAEASHESKDKDARIKELERALRARGKALGEAREAVSKSAVLALETEKRHAKEVAAAVRRGEGEGEALRRRDALRKARSEASELRSELEERTQEVEALRIKLSDSRDRLKAAKRLSDKCREETKGMREREGFANGQREAAKAELRKERERWGRERREMRRAKTREVAEVRAEIEDEAKTMVGETMRAALREVERLSMLCREQKNEISSLRTRLSERTAMRRDLEVAAEALSPDRRRSEMLSTSSSSPSSPSVLTSALASSRGVEDESVTSQTAHSVNESLRGLTREDLNESTSTTDAAAVPELDDAAETVTARLWAQASLFFREADRNHNGVLTHTEIRNFLRQHLNEKLKFGVHESGWRGLWAAMDRNKDGQLDEHEWCQFFVKTVSPFSHAWSDELEQGSRIRTVTDRGKTKASSRRKKGSNSTSGIRVGDIKKGVKSSRKLSPYAARPRRNRSADPYDILHTPPKELDGPQMADSNAAEASSSSSPSSSSSARIEVEVSDVMSTSRGIQNGGTPPLAQTKSPAMGSVLARSGGHGTTPHWSPLRSSEERWLDLGMSPHRPRAHGYVPRHGKVAALENDHNSALGIHEPRSTIRRSPSAAIYHEPSIVRHLTEGDDRRDDGGDDSNDAEVGLDEELIDRDAEEDEEGGDIVLEDSLDLGARVSAAEMLVRLRGVAGLVDGEGGAPEEEDEADTDETAKPASRKIKKLGAGKRKKMIPLDSKAGAVHKLKRPPKKKDKLKVVEEERERRIHEREQRRRKQAAQSSSFGMDDTSVSASLSMGLSTAPLLRAREQKAPSSKTRRRPHSKTKKASRDKRKKSVRVGADGSGGGDSSVANKARAASAASLRRATGRKKASKAGRQSGHLRSSKSAKKSARGATTSGASGSSEANIHKRSSRFSGSASMRVHQQAHQHLGGTGRRSQLLNNSYSGSIGLAHGNFARTKVRGGAGGVAGANAGTAMGAGVGQRWAEIKSSLVPRQGLGAKSSKTKRAASAGKKKMKTKKAKGGSTSRLQRLRAEREALEAAVREGDEALEQAAAAAAAAQQAGHQGTHTSLGQQHRAKHKRRFSLILAEIQDDAEGLEQPHLR